MAFFWIKNEIYFSKTNTLVPNTLISPYITINYVIKYNLRSVESITSKSLDKNSVGFFVTTNLTNKESRQECFSRKSNLVFLNRILRFCLTTQ